MPVNKYALLRYRIIDRSIGGKNFPNKEDLRQACEDSLYGSYGENISDSTIEKDIWAMRNETELGYYAPIKYSKADKGYYYEDEDYSISELSLSEFDLEAIQIAASTLNQFKDNPIFKQYGSAIDKIVNRMKISPNPEDKNLEKFIQFENTPISEGAEHLSPLFQAIKNKNQVIIAYQKFSSNEVKSYELHPYLLKEYKNRWYLIGYSEERKRYITFGLERITKLDVFELNFDKNSDFDVDRFFKHSFGITEINDEPVKVVLEVSKNQINYFKSQPIHESQKITGPKDDHSLLEIDVMITFELVQFIMGYGKEVKVLEPAILKTQILENLKATTNQYS